MVDVDIEWERGEPIALVGPNGAGKTTLLGILCGFVHADSGAVEVLGQAPGSAAVIGRLSALPQDAQLNPHRVVGAQLTHFARLRGLSRTAAARDVARVLEWVDLPQVAGARAAELSHGMRKRVAIAQALLGTPELVLLDEPTAGLDPENARQVRRIISDQSGATQFVVSSHNLDELERLCGSVVYIERGQVREQSRIGEASDTTYLTVGVDRQVLEPVQALLSGLPGVISVSRSAQGNLLIACERDQHDPLDIRILQTLRTEGLGYRFLMRGRTLEDQLFDTPESEVIELQRKS